MSAFKKIQEVPTDEGLEEEEVQEATTLGAEVGGPGRVQHQMQEQDQEQETTSSAPPQPNGRTTARHARVRVRLRHQLGRLRLRQIPELPEEQHQKHPEEQTAQHLPRVRHPVGQLRRRLCR